MIIKLSSVTYYLFHGRIFESSLKLTVFGQIGQSEGRPGEVKLDKSGRPCMKLDGSKGLTVHFGLHQKGLKCMFGLQKSLKWTASENGRSRNLKVNSPMGSKFDLLTFNWFFDIKVYGNIR